MIPFRRTMFLVAATMALALPSAAREPRAVGYGIDVVGSEVDRIEVFTRLHRPGGMLFCAAGRHARGPGGAGSGDRLTLIAPLEPSTKRPGWLSVVFRLSDRDNLPEEARHRLILWPYRTGASMSIGHAMALCQRYDMP